ncbi:MAG: 50S ribosomal protein L32 [Acidobacteriota bacterium]
MPNPRRRHSKTRRDKRRTGDALTPIAATECPQCHEPKLPHTVCKACGFYDGKRVLKVEEA